MSLKEYFSSQKISFNEGIEKVIEELDKLGVSSPQDLIYLDEKSLAKTQLKEITQKKLLKLSSDPNILSPPQTNPTPSPNANTSLPSLPSNSIQYSEKDILGEGSFGKEKREKIKFFKTANKKTQQLNFILKK